jgi:hypothetical protein
MIVTHGVGVSDGWWWASTAFNAMVVPAWSGSVGCLDPCLFPWSIWVGLTLFWAQGTNLFWVLVYTISLVEERRGVDKILPIQQTSDSIRGFLRENRLSKLKSSKTNT